MHPANEIQEAPKLDTSGHVDIGPDVPPRKAGRTVTLRMTWKDLSPFAQGYVEALLLEFGHTWADDNGYLFVSYRDLAREALAMILRDCEALARRVGYVTAADVEMGALVWAQRQRGELSDFPPLRVFLSDDGKVCLEPKA